MADINSTLRFNNYIVENIEFNTNYNYSGEDKKINFSIDNQCDFEENNFILHLGITIFPEAEKNDYPFTMKVRIVGLFEVDSQEDEKNKVYFAEKNSIAILFPYLRALISVYSSNANIGTVILPPINVLKYLEDKKNNKRQKEKGM
ncbi:protein-export chaperone SecB [Clostridium pasteurianum]|uniref:Preprotein translocase subunit SecB n=1 Tax=Clostridium pasteurianum BC1 TaxID=86416 RepID=R4K0U1_CLOPA|nr:protein-export chaperone SecB [Clostridium pasteurianum]AGK96707.1 preprotein translocase subunit SecB [Clostridium pasteurianum BC1]